MNLHLRKIFSTMLLGGVFVLIVSPGVDAQAYPLFSLSLETIQPQQQADAGGGQDENCLMCHSNPDFKGEFQDGELLSLYVDNSEYEGSVHGPAGLECVACHTAISSYPHHEEQITCTECHEADGGLDSSDYVTLRLKLDFADKREMTISINEACRSCHEQEFEVAADSAHVRAQLSGNRDAPLCVDCHGSHEISKPNEPRAKITHTCAQCHRAVYSTYKSSIHGEALESESNPDVPTCVNCHGVHSVRGPRDPFFRNDSITICGKCHGDEALMEKYGISTNIFESYLDDFHGRTVDLFRRQARGIPSNKATCFDCHGIHNIQSPNDPLSTVYPDNLQHTCQQCHPNASIRFPKAWLSHYMPTREEKPILYYLNLIYQVLIPATVGGFILYIGLDARKRWSERSQIVRKALEEEKFDDFDFTS